MEDSYTAVGGGGWRLRVSRDELQAQGACFHGYRATASQCTLMQSFRIGLRGAPILWSNTPSRQCRSLLLVNNVAWRHYETYMSIRNNFYNHFAMSTGCWSLKSNLDRSSILTFWALTQCGLEGLKMELPRSTKTLHLHRSSLRSYKAEDQQRHLHGLENLNSHTAETPFRTSLRSTLLLFLRLCLGLSSDIFCSVFTTKTFTQYSSFCGI
jgi:hypothetical protein